MKLGAAALIAIFGATIAQAGDQPVFVFPINLKANPEIVFMHDGAVTTGAFVRTTTDIAQSSGPSSANAPETGASGQTAVVGPGISHQPGSALYSSLLAEAQARGLK